MMKVQISALKSWLSKHLRAAEAGQIIEIMDRARPIARLVPIDDASEGLEIVPAELRLSSVRRVRLPPAKLRISSLKALRLERGSW